ncbi:hypothetical protein DICA1_D12134 [Diutina catenulata]
MIQDLRPREERDYKELYPDLDESDQLQVFVVDDDDEDTQQAPAPRVTHLAPTFSELETAPPTPLPASLARYGYQTTPRGHSEPQKTYHRPYQSPPTPEEEEEAFHVRYDMDEQDALYLEWGRTNGVFDISPEVLEVAMTFLDLQWAALAPLVADAPTQDRYLTLETDQDKYGNDDGIVPGSMYDQRCAVCNDSDCDSDNAIVFCDGCDIAVHQECYGIAFIPEGSWLCRWCMIARGSEPACVFCPSRTGAFKQLDNSQWAHVLCGLWINELYFANPIYMEPIEGFAAIPRSRWKLVCSICKKKHGACIQCYNRSCFTAYHVTCAKRAGLYMEVSEGIQGALRNKTTLKSFCDKHSPPNWGVDLEKCRNYYRDLEILKVQNAQLKRRYQAANRLNQYKWKTDEGAPIAPAIFAKRLTTHLKPLTKNNVANYLCRWWSLKRSSKRGALTKVPAHDHAVDASTAETLAADLSQLQELARTHHAAQLVAEEIQTVDMGLVERAYFPQHWIAQHQNANAHLANRDTKIVASHQRNYPFIEVDGANVRFKPYDYRQVLADADLSEVE